MGAFVVKLGPLYLWQAVVLVVVLASAAGGTYVGLDLRSDGDAGGVSDTEQLVFAEVGDLINVVSTDGALTFPNVERARFDVAGEVGDLLVVEGALVVEGQPLARLDAASIADLDLRLARAKETLREAEEAIEDAIADAAATADPLVVAKAEATVAKAELALQQAKGDVADMTAGPTTDELADAQAAIAVATTELVNTETSLNLVTRDWDQRMSAAQDDIDDAAAAYQEIFARWLGVPAVLTNVDLEPSVLLASWGADLAVLFEVDTSPTNLALSVNPPTDDPATAWNEATVYAWVAFAPGSPIGTCSDNNAPVEGTCLQLELDEDWDALVQERDDLETVTLDAAKAVASAENSVASRTSALENAEQAIIDLAELADPLAIGVANADVTVATATLVDAQEALDELSVEPDEADLEVLQAELATATLALQAAKDNLENATLLAPIPGIVSDIALETGQNALAQQAGITIVDPSVVELEGTVDEIDVLAIAQGDAAAIALSALPGEALRGVVFEIGTPTNQQGVVTFPVVLQLDVPEGLQLLEGLSATASIVISQELDVLRVPTAAIQGSFVRPFVRVVTSDGIEERQVELGSSDDFWVVVTAGLEPGEEVTMPAPSSGDSAFGNVVFGGGGFGQVDRQALRALQGGGGRRGGGGGGGGR